jgi:hypothetical protein
VRIARDRNQHWHAVNPPQPYIIQLPNDPRRLGFRKHNGSIRDMKIMCRLRPAPSSLGIFSRHRVPGSKVGAVYAKANCKE